MASMMASGPEENRPPHILLLMTRSFAAEDRQP